MAGAVGGPRPARRPAGGDRRRHLRRQSAGAGRLPAAGADRRQSRIPALACRHQTGLRPLSAFLRLRDRPGTRRQLVGSRRQDAGSLGRRIRAGEPRRDDPRLLGYLRRDAGPPPRLLLRRLPRRAAGHETFGRRPHRRADAGARQRDLLRTRLHRPISRLHAARGRGSRRRQGPRHGAHRRRPEADRGALAPP